MSWEQGESLSMISRGNKLNFQHAQHNTNHTVMGIKCKNITQMEVSHGDCIVNRTTKHKRINADSLILRAGDSKISRKYPSRVGYVLFSWGCDFECNLVVLASVFKNWTRIVHTMVCVGSDVKVSSLTKDPMRQN